MSRSSDMQQALMTHCFRPVRTAIAAAILTLTVSGSFAEEVPGESAGLPKGVDWTISFDATLGAFGFANSYYTNPRPDEPSGDLSDNWFEGSLKGGIEGVYTTPKGSHFYGQLSAVGERTYGAGSQVVGDEASSFGVEDAYLGWRSGTLLGGLGEDAVDFTVGRTRYRLGHGMLLWDGAAEGGTRGGYWTNARQAFEFAAIGRFKPGNHTLEAFYLEKDELPDSNTDTELWGVNYEYAIGEATTLGATYMKFSANPVEAPERDGLDVYNARIFTAPFSGLKGLSFELEYAQEDNGELLDSAAWNALVAYQLDTGWKPKFSYRYAIFEGDDPNTSTNEAFDGLLTGFSDWGAWWQGEIAGEYFVSNSNLISHQLRVHMAPSESISTGLILYDFLLDNPESAGVTSDEIALELDWYMDWSVNDNFTISFVAAVADPKEAVEQSSGRDDTFYYGMIFVAYSY
jgi:hypothetical protein